MSNTATRLITLIMLLQRQPSQKAADLAAALGVSVRTFHRYIGMLEEIGIPVASERGPYGGFSLVRGYKLPPLIFTPDEAVTLYIGASMAAELWGSLLTDAAMGALAKRENVLPDEQRREAAWATRSLVATGFHRSDKQALAPYLEILRLAVHERQMMRMSYRTGGRTPAEERDVDPYALVYRWGYWYVIGYCHLREALRSFRVDRIGDLQLLPSHFEIPAGFDLRRYLASEPDTLSGFSARLRFPPELAHVPHDNRVMWASLQERADGSVEVDFNSPDLPWAVSLVLSFGSSVEVLAPAALRRELQQEAQAIAARYAE